MGSDIPHHGLMAMIPERDKDPSLEKGAVPGAFDFDAASCSQAESELGVAFASDFLPGD